MPAGTLALAGTEPTCTVVHAGRRVPLHPRAARPAPEVADWKGTVEPTVDATKHVNGGCRSLRSDGLEWECYIGEEAVAQQIVGAGLPRRVRAVARRGVMRSVTRTVGSAGPSGRVRIGHDRFRHGPFRTRPVRTRPVQTRPVRSMAGRPPARPPPGRGPTPPPSRPTLSMAPVRPTGVLGARCPSQQFATLRPRPDGRDVGTASRPSPRALPQRLRATTWKRCQCFARRRQRSCPRRRTPAGARSRTARASLDLRAGLDDDAAAPPTRR